MNDFAGSVEAGNPGADAAGVESAQSFQEQGNQAYAQEQAWYSGLPEDARGLVEVKGWKGPEDAIQSYVNLEKMLGADKAGRGLVMPKEDAEASEWGQFYDKLGRPASPDQYNLPIPQGDTGEFAKVAANKFHELGITAKQAESLAEWWNNNSQQMQQAQINQQMQNAEMELQVLQSEWGKEYDQNIEAARRATREFGVQEQVLQKIEDAIGTREMLKLFANVGKGLGEAQFVEGSRQGGLGMSPEAARVRLGQLKGDKEWSAKYLSGNADAKAEMERLMRLAYPG
jgi:hypothetical protein